jgi:membrane protease YdiL (CAAX protease family)
LHGIKGLASIGGGALALSALAWLGANICVGIAEEFWFRSYFQQMLWKSIGFWPATIVIALTFAAEHYFFKQGENVWDVITLVSLSMLLSYTMLRTGGVLDTEASFLMYPVIALLWLYVWWRYRANPPLRP